MYKYVSVNPELNYDIFMICYDSFESTYLLKRTEYLQAHKFFTNFAMITYMTFISKFNNISIEEFYYLQPSS